MFSKSIVSIGLSALVFLGSVKADATVKRTVLIPKGESKNTLCAKWKTECTQAAADMGLSRLLRCKTVTPTLVTVTCVSKDLVHSKTPEGQLTDSLIVKMGLKVVKKSSSGSTSTNTKKDTTSTKKDTTSTKKDTTTAKGVTMKVDGKVVPVTAPATFAKKDLTIKRQVFLAPKYPRLGALCKDWKLACAAAAQSEAHITGFLFRCKPIGTTKATVTCVSKDFDNPKDKIEMQLTDFVIAKLGLSGVKV